MPAYSASLARATHASQYTVGSLVSAATTKRIGLRRLVLGMSGTPADSAYRWVLARITAAGTSTSLTPTELDPSDPACTTVCGINHSAEPTYTAGKTLKTIDLHQRATFHMELAPGRLIYSPATAANGFGIKVTGTAGINCCADTEFEE
jgi:hypothetical protein